MKIISHKFEISSLIYNYCPLIFAGNFACAACPSLQERGGVARTLAALFRKNADSAQRLPNDPFVFEATVACLMGNDVTSEPATEQRQIPKQVDGLVTHELVRPSQLSVDYAIA